MKKSKPTHGPNDISIGPDEWIRFVEIAGRDDKVHNMDAFIQPVVRFWKALEIECVAECCGIQAFSFWPADIWNAARSSHDPELKTKLESLRQSVASVSLTVVDSLILNQLFDRDVFLRLLDHVITQVNQMTPSASR